MPSLKSIISRSPSIVTRKTGNEYVLVPIANNIADMTSVYTLNETGAYIWDQIDGKRSIEEIIVLMTSEYEVGFETAREDVFEFVEKMGKYLIVV